MLWLSSGLVQYNNEKICRYVGEESKTVTNIDQQLCVTVVLKQRLNISLHVN